VTGRAPYIAGQGMVARGKTVSGVMVRGVLPSEEMQVSEFGDRLIEGQHGGAHVRANSAS
jgi:lipoprotein-releasing system permease protein